MDEILNKYSIGPRSVGHFLKHELNFHSFITCQNHDAKNLYCSDCSKCNTYVYRHE